MDTVAMTLPPRQPEKNLGDPFLRLCITPKAQALLPMHHVQEVLTLPAQRLTPVPNVPACLLGLLNCRSRVIWAVDLSQILNLPGYDANRREYDLVIIRTEAIALALVVHQIGGLCWLPSDAIQPPPSQLPVSLQAYLRGCTIQEQDIWLVLDATAIVQSASLRNF